MLLAELRAHTGGRTLTLTAPGEDLPGVREALPTTLANLLRLAVDAIEQDGTLMSDQRSGLLARLPTAANIVAQVPPRHGVWVAVSEDHDATAVPLSPGVRVDEAIALDDQVALVRPLVEHEQRGTELLVLTLSDGAADLSVLDVRSKVAESIGDPFPFSYPGDGTGSRDRSSSRQRDERRRHHWRRVAEAAHRVVVRRDLPVVTVGVDRNQGFLREVTAWPDELAVAVLGSPDAMDAQELADRVIEAAEEHRRRRIDETTRMVVDRAAAGRVATGMTDLHAAAVAGRIELLVLVDGPAEAGYLTDSGHLVAEDPGGATRVGDVDALGAAEAVRRGSDVVLAPAGSLAQSTATLRW
jgi:hypothetical protein